MTRPAGEAGRVGEEGCCCTSGRSLCCPLGQNLCVIWATHITHGHSLYKRLPNLWGWFRSVSERLLAQVSQFLIAEPLRVAQDLARPLEMRSLDVYILTAG